MKSLDELTYSELRQFMLANRCNNFEEAVDVYAKELTRHIDVEINPIMLAAATGADVEILEEEKRLRDFLASLRESIPSDIIAVIKEKTGPRGVKTFIVNLQKLFLETVSNPPWIKYEHNDISGHVYETVIQDVIESAAARAVEREQFDIFEGTTVVDDDLVAKQLDSQRKAQEFMDSFRRE